MVVVLLQKILELVVAIIDRHFFVPKGRHQIVPRMKDEQTFAVLLQDEMKKKQKMEQEEIKKTQKLLKEKVEERKILEDKVKELQSQTTTLSSSSSDTKFASSAVIGDDATYPILLESTRKLDDVAKYYTRIAEPRIAARTSSPALSRCGICASKSGTKWGQRCGMRRIVRLLAVSLRLTTIFQYPSHMLVTRVNFRVFLPKSGTPQTFFFFLFWPVFRPVAAIEGIHRRTERRRRRRQSGVDIGVDEITRM